MWLAARRTTKNGTMWHDPLHPWQKVRKARVLEVFYYCARVCQYSPARQMSRWRFCRGSGTFMETAPWNSVRASTTKSGGRPHKPPGSDRNMIASNDFEIFGMDWGFGYAPKPIKCFGGTSRLISAFSVVKTAAGGVVFVACRQLCVVHNGTDSC
jgi:hypothetical protein